MVLSRLQILKNLQRPLFYGLFLAFLGGLILNVMPCVLPVLAMKLNGIISIQNIAKSKIRYQFLATTAGIIIFFFLTRCVFNGCSTLSGHAIGWGIQFQSPYFIGFMCIVTLLFTFNLLGLFNINLPNANTKLSCH